MPWQVLSGLINLPWAVKPLIGLVSDVLPFMGFRKVPGAVSGDMW